MFDFIIGFLFSNETNAIASIVIIIFLFLNWWANAKWKEEVAENQKQIIELLKGKSNKEE